MGMFKNIKISAKILALVMVMELIIISTAVHGLSMLSDVSDRYQTIYTDDAEAALMGHELEIDVYAMRYNLSMVVTSPEQDRVNLAKAGIEKSMKDIDEHFSKLNEKAKSAKGKELMANLKSKLDALKSNTAGAVQYRTSIEMNGVAGNPHLRPLQGIYGELETMLEDVSETAQTSAGSEMAAMADEIDSQFYINLVISLVMIVLSLGIGWALAQHIAERIKELTVAAEKIANGDLTTEVRNASGDEIGDAAANFEIMRQRMHESIADIRVAADQVAAGSKNVSEASVNLSQGAAEQASSVEQLSASISEISSQTASNATNADRANELTDLAQQHANVGNTEMKNMLAAMEEINVSSANISKIIKVIDEIAFQTNILALNAAVEAARAGQHGKGFAVVAEEVRNLAARSAKAAKETTDLIEGSIEKVNGGREIANKTAEALSTIVGNVAEVADIVSAIAKASNEQKVALEQINQGVLQVSQVVQANSATSEEAASASEELNAQAQRMKETTARFRINGSAPAISVSPAAPVETPMPMPRVQNVQPISGTGMSGAKPALKVAPGVKSKTIALTDDEGFGKY